MTTMLLILGRNVESKQKTPFTHNTSRGLGDGVMPPITKKPQHARGMDTDVISLGRGERSKRRIFQYLLNALTTVLYGNVMDHVIIAFHVLIHHMHHKTRIDVV